MVWYFPRIDSAWFSFSSDTKSRMWLSRQSLTELRISQEGLANQSVKVKVQPIDLSAATPCFFISIFLYTFLIPRNVMCISDDVKSHYSKVSTKDS